MKKFIFVSIALMLCFVPVFCQTIDPATPPPPNNWGDVLVNFKEYFASFAGVVVLTAFVSAVLNGLIGITKSFVKQITAWVVAMVVLTATDLLNFGYAADFPITLALAHGFAAGLASNGIFDIPFFNGILDKIHGFFSPKPKIAKT